MVRKYTFAAILLLALSSLGFAQESNNGKEIWAESFLNKKAPQLYVQEWLSKAPETKGKFLLIDFWATWCGPCREAIPHMNEFAKKFSDNLIVIGISNEPKATIEKMKSPVMEYYSGRDASKTMQNELKIKGIPHVILVDPKGIVRWEGFPLLEGHELTAEVIETLIKKYK